MRAGSLFSGIEGLGLGLERAGLCQTVWFSEVDPHASSVLARHYPDVPNHGDITAIDWTQVEPVDVLHGGFPCQDISTAGKGAGIAEGTRSGLWSEYVRAIRTLRPRLVVIENVAALLHRGGDRVLADLAEGGFDAEWTTLRASDVGAAHRRERVFIVAYAAGNQGRFSDRDGGAAAHAERSEWRTGSREGATGRQGNVGTGGWLQGAGPSCGDTTVAADSAIPGRSAWGTGTDQQPRASGLAAGDSEAAADLNGGGCGQRCEPDGGTDGPELEASRRGDAGRRGQTPTDADGRGKGPHQRGAAPEVGGGRGRVEGQEPRRPSVDFGDYAPAIRRWEHVLGRPAPAPTVDGRLSPQFVEWHMGFPQGWTEGLSRNQALKCLGNAVVPQCAEVIGRWAVGLTAERAVA